MSTSVPNIRYRRRVTRAALSAVAGYWTSVDELGLDLDVRVSQGVEHAATQSLRVVR